MILPPHDGSGLLVSFFGSKFEGGSTKISDEIHTFIFLSLLMCYLVSNNLMQTKKNLLEQISHSCHVVPDYAKESPTVKYEYQTH